MSGYNDWITFDYKNKYFCMNPIDLKFRNKQSSIEHTIEQMVGKYENLYVSLSGGLDSEFVAKCLYEHGVKFTPIIVDYKSNANEIWYAHRWCYEYKIKPIIIKLTRDDIITNFAKISEKYNTAFICAIDFIVETYVSKLHGRLITSAAEPFDRINSLHDDLTAKTSYMLDFRTYDLMLDYYMPHKHSYNFLIYTPDLLYNIVKNLDYEKPVQLAMSEYYGILPRPKINSLSNIVFHGDSVVKLMSDSNSKRDLSSICVGNKDEFLKKFENGEIIYGIFK